VQVHALSPLPKTDLAEREKAAQALNTELAQALLKTGPFDMVYERYSLWSYAGIALAKRFGTPSVLEVNAPLIEEQSQHRGLVNEAEARRIAKQVFANASLVSAVSQEVANYVKLSEAKTNVVVSPNGVNLERFSPTVPATAPCSKFTLGFVGTLKPWHGLDTLVAAFESLSDEEMRLLIVGDGPERSRLETLLSPKYRQQVEFTGAVSPEEIPGLLSSMDVAVAPYPALEHFYFSPLKLYEYMAAGLPVVASQIGQISQIINHGHNGLLYEAGNSSALAQSLAYLKEQAELRERLSLAARATAETHSWDANLGKLLSHLNLEKVLN
ncbi:MAG: glycosyltransferase family 4 protein, partial [Trueperaceae bacterium]|nr:glycosyltransferase family 4 protein [Trueperaceae bacterium]